MIKIDKLSKLHVPAVLQIAVAEQQIKFAETAEAFLANIDNTTHLHIIKSDDEIIGFFKIDLAYASIYSFCPDNGLGLRSFVIDTKQQGKGFGTAAVKALLVYLRENYPCYSAVYLTVNCQNIAAHMCYLKGGFTDTGEKYLGGIAGPQYIMKG
ncbi:GNAT family N-acetyltransferase [uncultured Shewanella sp.]|uniref:GNAT family N-acetyltransferase n=1 Tax=uncultured Shewanella sp. TaxID=173975 RepID=UPI0026294571|nr:GNAT family N-acetyltransferase [uncultured Shewanella sp.]